MGVFQFTECVTFAVDQRLLGFLVFYYLLLQKTAYTQQPAGFAGD
jgi:hypothetical protein